MPKKLGPTADALVRCRHEFESGHCGHCGVRELRQPAIPSGRVPPEPYLPTPREFWSVLAGITLLCIAAIAVGIATGWWPAFVVALVCFLTIILGIIRLIADAVKGGE